MRKSRPGRVLTHIPGRRRPRGRSDAPGRRLPLLNSKPCTPDPSHPPKAHVDETYRRFTQVHPSGLPLAYAPDESRVASASTPGLRTPPLPATHARVGTAIEHLPGLRRRRHRRPAIHVPLAHAASCRTIPECPSGLCGLVPSQVPISQRKGILALRHAQPARQTLIIAGSTVTGRAGAMRATGQKSSAVIRPSAPSLPAQPPARRDAERRTPPRRTAGTGDGSRPSCTVVRSRGRA